MKSIKGQPIEWVVKVGDVDTGPDGIIYLRVYSGIYSSWINDPTKKFTDFAKDDIVKVKGTVSNVVNIFGLTVEIDPESVTKI